MHLTGMSLLDLASIAAGFALIAFALIWAGYQAVRLLVGR